MELGYTLANQISRKETTMSQGDPWAFLSAIAWILSLNKTPKFTASPAQIASIRIISIKGTSEEFPLLSTLLTINSAQTLASGFTSVNRTLLAVV
jgi:hypothetical protein